MSRCRAAGAIAVLLAGLGAGCVAPGVGMDEGHFESQTYAGPKGETEHYKIEPITPKLIEAQAKRTFVPPTRDISDKMQEELRDYRYKVGPHDVLNITVFDHPELTIPQGQFRSAQDTGNLVNSDGNIFFPYVGAVHVAGRSLDEIRTEMTQRISKYIERAQLDVRVAAFRSQRVHVIGEVQDPGFLPITDVPLTALEAVNLSKGFSQEADPQNVVLVRKGVPHHIDLLALYENGDLSQNWVLQDGDVLHVGDRSHNKVFVLGEAREPAIQAMYKGKMTLAEALGGAKFLDQTTSNGLIYIIRGSLDHPEVYRLDVSEADALLLAVEFQLKPLDVVYVSTYGLTRFNRVLSQITPAVSALFQVAFGAQTVNTLAH